MRVLITGSAGHLGRAVVHHLVEVGLDIRATDRRHDPKCPAPQVTADLLDPMSAYRLLDGCQALVHLGNHANQRSGVAQQVYRENLAMNVNLFQAAAELGVKRIVFSSTIQVTAGNRSGERIDRPSALAYLPMDGALPACPTDLYGASKQATESLLQHYVEQDPALSATVVRFPYIMPDSHRQHWNPRELGRLRPWDRPDECFTYLMLSDAVRLIQQVLERQTPGYHQYFAAAPDNALGWPVQELIELCYPDMPIRAELPMQSLVDISALKRDVGWSPIAPPLVEAARV